MPVQEQTMTAWDLSDSEQKVICRVAAGRGTGQVACGELNLSVAQAETLAQLLQLGVALASDVETMWKDPVNAGEVVDDTQQAQPMEAPSINTANFLNS